MDRTSRQEQSQAARQRARRVRNLLRNELGWTRGVPSTDGLGWLALTPGGGLAPMDLNRELLMSSTRAFKTLRTRHLDRLEHIVGDVQLWEAGVHYVLDQVGQLVHDQVPLPKSVVADLGLGSATAGLVRSTLRTPPSTSADSSTPGQVVLHQLIGDLSWVSLAEPHLFRSRIETVKTEWPRIPRTAALERSQLLFLLLMSAEHGGLPTYLGYVCDSLAAGVDHDIHLSAQEVLEGLEELIRASDPDAKQNSPRSKVWDFDKQPLDLGEQLRAHLSELQALPAAHRRGLLALGRSVLNGVDVSDWQSQTSEIEEVLNPARALLDRVTEPDTEVSPSEAGKLAGPLREAILTASTKLPASTGPSVVLRSMNRLAERWPASSADELAALVAAMPAGDPSRTLLLHSFGEAARWDFRWQERFELGELTQAIKEDRQAWLKLLAPGDLDLEIMDLAADLLEVPEAHRRMAMESLDDLVALGAGVSHREYSNCLGFAAAGIAPSERVVRLVEEAERAGMGTRRWYSIADALDVAGLEFMVDFLKALPSDWREGPPGLNRAIRLLNSWEVSMTCPAAGSPLLTQLHSGLVAYSNSGGPRFGPPPPVVSIEKLRPDLAERIPSRFHPQLSLVASRGRGADAVDRVVDSVLAKSFPATEDLDRQITALRVKLFDLEGEEPQAGERSQASPLAKRLEALERRRDARPDPSDKELDRLDRRLERAVAEQLLAALVEFVESAHRDHLAEALGAWVREAKPSLFPAIDALRRCREPYRSLGLSVISANATGSSQTFVDHAPNQAFINDAVAAGLDVEPWLSGLGISEIVLPTDGDDGDDDGEDHDDADSRLTVDLETDPMEVLLMGQPFGTCLSPGDFNFWSAVVNAVDVNKAMIAGRIDGKLVARCLIAIDNDYRLIRYRSYAHETANGFNEAAEALLERLASKMRTAVASDGHPQPLLTENWYDDTPVTIADFENEVERTAEGMEVEEFARLIEQSGVSVRRLVEWCLWEKELPEQPDLVRHVLSLVGPATQMPTDQWAELAGMARAIGEDGFANRIVEDHIGPKMRSLLAGQWIDSNVLLAIAPINPVATLRAVRTMRSPTVRSDIAETDPGRRAVLVACHRQLGNYDLAARLAVAPNAD